MESALLIVMLVALFVRWLVLSGKMNAMQQKIEVLSADAIQPMLIARVYALEQTVKELRAMRPGEAPVTPPASPVLEPKPEAKPKPMPMPMVFEPVVLEPVVLEPDAPRVWEPVKLETAPPPLPKSEPESVPVPSFSTATAQPAGPSLSQRVRESMKGEEWEAVVGGSWLNKLGVLVLVIGIALFLGYSFTQVGPGGRAAIGLGVSLVMLGGGFLIEKKPRYKIFARGLLGGG